MNREQDGDDQKETSTIISGGGTSEVWLNNTGHPH
jgi:hypothetical protein